jgi:hypothetical protein
MHTVKIPLRFRGKENHPPNTPQDLEELNQNSLRKESRFWTYLLEDVKTEDVSNPAQYVMLDQMLTSQRMKDQGIIPSPHHLKVMSSTGVSTTSPATSSTALGVTSQPGSSSLT